MTDIQVKCFLALAEHLNFTQAARDLCISQSTLSMHISALEKKIGEIHSITTLLDVGNTPETILQYILGDLGLEINEKLPAKFTCNCNKSRIERALISVGKKDIQEMIDDGKPIEVNCHFCNKNYTFDVDELKDILEKARG